MPGNPKECRENAKQCLELASGARTQAGRERFEGLAQRWIALANDYEVANLLLANWRIPTAQDGLVAPILRCEAEAESNSEPAACQALSRRDRRATPPTSSA
jgi:hypothetical protein